jgi:hypothetical protein
VPKRIQVSDETAAMIEKAKSQMRGWNGQKRISDAAALDWLLQDIREYGSPVVRAFARDVYGPLPGECKHGNKLSRGCRVCDFITKLDPSPAPGTTP